VFLVAKTVLSNPGVRAYFDAIGLPEYELTGPSDGDKLVEMAGRLCYRSWQAYDADKPEATNPNVTKIREGNGLYVKNIIDSGHGAVLEHVMATFAFKDVSRVFTHELVRHRAGMAYSQESLRYVRLTDLPFWMPSSLRDASAIGTVDQKTKAMELLIGVVNYLEDRQRDLAEIFGIDDEKNFHIKKQLTSMFRRIAPIGLATSILVTANLRSWRHVIELRTSPAAEEEIRLVIGKAARILKNEFPSSFQDMTDDDGVFTFARSKV
jgi:thymidylate synthase (FAD)